MIKEITKITEDSKYWCMTTKSDLASMTLSTKMVEIEPDEFIDDDFYAEQSLIEDILNNCIKQNNMSNNDIVRHIPQDASKVEHYSNIIEMSYTLAQQIIYNNTKMFTPNFVICSGDILPMLPFTKGYKSCPSTKIEGTYKAGMLRDIIVLISPILDRGQMIWGVNNDMSPSIVTFKNKDNKICNKIVNNNHFALINIKDEFEV
jgi:hypothetical protein